MFEWIQFAGIRLRGKPYAFDKHEYLKQIVDDHHPDQTFLKGAQVGISTVVLLKAIYVAEHLGKKAIYFFQDDQAVSDFSNDRCQPMIDDSPYLLARSRGGTGNVGLKHFGHGGQGNQGSIFFRGLFSKGSAKSIDADLIVLDEVSEMKDENRQLARDRIMHSDLQWMMHLSQPDVPGRNIDAEFSTTDQHYWNVICPGCGHRNSLELTFPENFFPVAELNKKSLPDGMTHYRGCLKCKTKLNVGQGEWIAKFPNRVRRGYHLSQLNTQILPPGYPNYASAIMAEYQASKISTPKMARFTISVLGFGYGGGSVRVTEELLDRAEGVYGFSYGESAAYMGVDQGDTLTIVIGIRSANVLTVVYLKETEDWAELDYFMSQYGIAVCVIDALPNKHSAKSFAARFPGRVFIQYFGTKDLKKGIELHENSTEIDTLGIDRTDSIDAMIDKIESQQIIIPARSQCSGSNLMALEEARRHLQALTIKYETNHKGVTRRVYDSGQNVRNHYGMAMNSCSLAAFEIGVAPGPMCLPVFRRVA